MPVLVLQIGTKLKGVNSIFAKKGNWGELGRIRGGGALCHVKYWIVKLHRKVSKTEAWPPLWKLRIRFDLTKGMFCAVIRGLYSDLGKNSDQI